MKAIVSLLILFTIIFAAPAHAQVSEDFKLFSATDNSQFTLSDQKGKFVALHFLLKTECPYCIRHTHEYFSKAGTLPNVVQVFIKPDTEEEIKEWATNLPDDEQATLPIYRDPDAKLATKLNIPHGYKFHGQMVHYPAMILIGPDGQEVFRYIGKNNSDRFSFDQLVLKVQELTKR